MNGLYKALWQSTLVPLVLWLAWVPGAFAEAPDVDPATYTISDYEMEIRREQRSPFARFRLRLTYEVSAGIKEKGFKYVGFAPPHDVRAYDRTGQTLQADAVEETTSGEHRINFALPQKDAGGKQIVYVEFSQRHRPTYGLREEVIEVPWAYRFKVPVDKVRIALPLEKMPPRAMQDWLCRDAERGVLCLQTVSAEDFVANRYEGLRVKIPTELNSKGMFVWILAAGFSVFLMGAIARVRYRVLISEKGVLPPVVTPEPTGRDPYRAPPPLPVQGEPVLPKGDRWRFLARMAFALFAPFVFALGILGSSEVQFSGPMVTMLLSSGMLLGGAVLCLFYVASATGLSFVPLGLYVGGLGTLWAGEAMAYLFAFAPLALWLFFKFIKALGTSGGGGGGSWSGGGGGGCSGGGGSSCGGGGGGGGCGGGGGGGGCGG